MNLAFHESGNVVKAEDEIKSDILNLNNSAKLDKLEGSFDKILLDAPCSGEGMFRKDDDLIKYTLPLAFRPVT